MTLRSIGLAAPAFAVVFASPTAPKAQSVPPSAATFTEPLVVEREQILPDAAALPVPRGFTREQIRSAIAFSTARRRADSAANVTAGTPKERQSATT